MTTEIIRPKSNLMLSSASDIDALCTDIKKLGITFFSHTRVFDDGSKIDINNHAKMIEEFYYGKDKMYEMYTPEMKPKAMPGEVILLDNLEDNPSFQFLREGYDIDHMLVKIEKHNTYCDVWNFGTTRDNKRINNTYLNHLDTLVLFTYFYRDKCHDLILACEKDPIFIKETSPDTNTVTNEKNNTVFQEIHASLKSKTNRYFLNDELNNETHLTKSEMECCYWIYHGKTSEEIAIITYRSKRTIEKHIENIKDKLCCHNKGQLITTIKKLGLF